MVNQNPRLFCTISRATLLCVRRLFFLLSLLASPLCAQEQSASADGSVRVSVVINPDGSRTAYELDYANRRGSATTTGKDGKVREKIKYVLDENGRFARGSIFAPDGKFRFRATYKYDGAGHQTEEARTAKDGSSLGRIVYQYDSAGRQSGYATYDEKGNLIGQTSAAQPPPKAGH